MVRRSSISIWLFTVLSVIASSHSFLWLGGRKVSSERSQQMPLAAQPYMYRSEGSPWTAQYTYENPVPPMAVALPLALPMAPVSGGLKSPSPVQLVPCLCPISRDDPQQQQQQQPAGYVVQQQPTTGP